MSLTVTATAKTELQIAPRTKQRMLLTLKSYQETKAMIKVLEAALAKDVEDLTHVLDQLGEAAVELDGFKVTRVTGTYKKLNEQKLVELGCAIAWIREATENHPKKSYTKVTCPGEKGESHE
mgnify:CR=1 FL=1